MAEFEQNRVSKITWDWTGSGNQKAQVTSTSQGHKKVLVTTPIALVIAYCVHRFLGHSTMALVIVGIALFIAFSAFCLPSVYQSIDRFFLKFGHWVGTAVTWLLMVPCFYLVFVPGRLLFQVAGKNPMKLGYDKGLDTYWAKHPGITREEHYRRQH